MFQLHASDQDLGDNGEVAYSLAPSTSSAVAAMFGVDGTSGAVYTLKRLDHETGAAHFLSIVARDNGAPTALAAYAKVKVMIADVNDHAPRISVHALSSGSGSSSSTEEDVVQIVEGTIAGTFIAQVSVQDPDSGANGHFTCELNSPDFVLQPLTESEFKLLTTSVAEFDREVQETHMVVLRCTDQGDVPKMATKYITVHVTDVNDHSPVFGQREYVATIAENNVAGTYITRVNASDSDSGQNARITYSLEVIEPVGLDINNVVSIQRDTGIVTADAVLDHEDFSQYIFRIIAEDRGEPRKSATSTLTLNIRDVNDCAPQFSQDFFTFGTFENQAEQTEIGTLTAIDRDNEPYNEIRYSLDPRLPDSSIFDIDPHSGRITTRKVLDREIQYRYDLRVFASNEGYYLTGSTNVTVHVADKNDNAPVITYPQNDNNTVEVSTLAEVGSPIAQIEAYDQDLGLNAALTFSIVSGNDAGFFEMDPVLGFILVARDLSKEPSQYQAIVILVKDQGQPELSSVSQFQFHINDSAAIIAAENAKKSSNTTAILVICLLVFVITGIVVILFVLVVLRRRRRKQRESQKYNCRMAEANKSLRPGSADQKDKESKKGLTENLSNNSLQWQNGSTGSPTVIVVSKTYFKIPLSFTYTSIYMNTPFHT